MFRVLSAIVMVLVTPTAVWAGYKLPPQEIVDILDAPLTPQLKLNAQGNSFLLAEYQAYPPISLLARPFLRLAGLRIDPALHAEQREQPYTGVTIHALDGKPGRRVALPDGAQLGAPVWSPDGQRFAFTRDSDQGVELWLADARSGQASAIANLRVNDVLGFPFTWQKDGRHLLVRALPQPLSAAPATPLVPDGPNVEETAGKFSQVMTWQDLLKTGHDEQLFEYYGTSQLLMLDVQTGQRATIGAPGLYTGAEWSPDGQYLLVHRLKRPFSYRVPYDDFARSSEVWNKSGQKVATAADLPVTDQVPRHGVHTGPRSVMWQPLVPARLLWVEALDGGDPLKKVPHRDQLMSWDAPFKGVPQLRLKLQHRFSDLDWTAKPNQVVVTEFDRDRRWRTSARLDLQAPDKRKVLFDLSVNDAYGDPGSFVYERRSDGQVVMQQDGDWAYLIGDGATAKGDRPFLDRIHLQTGEKKRLFQSDTESYEYPVRFVEGSRDRLLTRHETPTSPPNFMVRDLAKGTRMPLTAFKDPAPQLTGVKKELVTYKRADGVPLSGTLYLPPGHKPGTRLPVFIWAYPLDYSDASTAGQVTGSTKTFTRLAGTSPLFLLTQGYAVLNNATMPVVGDPETMNDTFVDQIVGAAQAAIDKLDAMGVADRKRVLVGGHSYGAFMTANLLAHSDLFAAGIARSGAYNRSLTPFGFQSERRSYWEATDVYTRLSPFTFAHRIKTPLLMIHGEADNNPGTYTIQSQRLFQAIQGNGGTARLVLLPHESHGYRARESVLHVLAEMIEWADRYVKNP